MSEQKRRAEMSYQLNAKVIECSKPKEAFLMGHESGWLGLYDYREELESERDKWREAAWEHAKTLAEFGAICQTFMCHDEECARHASQEAVCDCGAQAAYDEFDMAVTAYDTAVKEF